MTARTQLAECLSRYTPELQARARAAIRTLEQRVPGATRLVYDNYNALVVGFGPSERASDAIFSIAVYPRWVNLFFLQGAELDDPDRILKGSGSRVRHVRLDQATDLDRASVQALIRQALRLADPPMPSKPRGRLVVKSVSTRQRPRRVKPAARARASTRRR